MLTRYEDHVIFATFTVVYYASAFVMYTVLTV